jgi:predicted dehydrogenase
MSLDLTPEQKATGKANFEQAAGDLARDGQMKTMAVGGQPADPAKPDRRDFLRTGLAVGAVVPVSAAVYFGYDSWKGGDPVRTAVIGTGDEGGVLVGEHNPEFNKIVAVCDIRPTQRSRIFNDSHPIRKGLKGIYGKDAEKEIRQFNTVDELLAKKDELKLEMVIIATPLNTHDVIAKKCMDAGLHVLCEKLMAWNIKRCKEMTQYAKQKGVLLSIGHQRHYSSLYAQAIEVLNSGVVGEIKHIRALWHRNNSWPYDKSAFYVKDKNGEMVYDPAYGIPHYNDSWWKEVPVADAKFFLENPQILAEAGFGTPTPQKGEDDPVARLIRWRIYNETGGGLMAELGSHQLDASSIILDHVHPIAVHGSGGKYFYGPGRNNRDCDDSVFLTYEFPGPAHPKAGKGGNDENDIVVVTYSSLNTNEFEGYGEWVMGTKGTMFLEKEESVYLFKERDKSKKGDKGGRDVKITVDTGGRGPVMEATSTWGGGGGAAISKDPKAGGWDTAVRGYRTEMEHFAFCVREWQKRKGPVSYEKNKDGHLVHADIMPRCHGAVATADAILALTGRLAMETKERIEFDEKWFDVDNINAVPTSKSGKTA